MIANIISGASLIVAAFSLGYTIFVNCKNHKQYTKSLSPQLSFILYQRATRIFLTVKNTGKSAAINLKIKLLSIEDNGNNKDFLDHNIFNKELVLYPNEEFSDAVAFIGDDCCNITFPRIRIEVSYNESISSEKVCFERLIVCSKEIINNTNALSSVADSLDSIKYSENRIANYVEGRTFLEFDRLNALPHSSLYKYIYDAMHKEERKEEKVKIKNKE